jgi:hypothetical protein
MQRWCSTEVAAPDLDAGRCRVGSHIGADKWILRGLWLVGAAICELVMSLFPAYETIPFHLIWIGLSLVYGFAV